MSINHTGARSVMTNSTLAHTSELLQMIFHNLPLFDLTRCQRVCKTWNAYLPGNDPTLREAFFLRAKVADEEEHQELSISTFHGYTYNDSGDRIKSRWKVSYRLSALGKQAQLHPVFPRQRRRSRVSLILWIISHTTLATTTECFGQHNQRTDW